MFRAHFPSYFTCGRRILSAACSKKVSFPSIHSCNIENREDDLRDRKYFKTLTEGLTKNSQTPKSVLFELVEGSFAPLASCNSVEEVLKYLKSDTRIEHQLYANVFRTIFNLFEAGKTKLTAEELCRKEEFESISQNVKKHVHLLKVEDALTILKILFHFGISTNSLLCQSLLQMISKNVNKLGVKQISLLHSILSNSSPSPLVDALKIAIPIVFEAHVLSQLDEDDPTSIAFAVQFAFQQEAISDDTRNMLVEIALKKIEEFKAAEISKTLRSLRMKKDSPENVQNLFRKLLNKAAENIDQLRGYNIIKIVRLTIDNYLYVHESFFDENLVKKSVQHFINKGVDILRTTKLLRQLSRISYYCPELLDYIDEHYKLSSSSFKDVNGGLVVFIKSCSDCMYKPKNWDSYEREILSHLEEKVKSDDTTVRWIGVVTDLLILKCWPKALVEHCFQNDNLQKILFREHPTDYINLLSMYQIVKLLYSDHYAGPYPPAVTLEKAFHCKYKKRDHHLFDTLQVTLGGPQYILKDVKTAFGQLVDYLIVKRKSGEVYPVNPTQITGSCDLLYESLTIPEDSFSIAIVLMYPEFYCLDGHRLTGKTEIILQCLETYGMTTLPISYYQLLALKDSEKIDYFMEKINQCIPVMSPQRSNDNI